MTTAKPKHMAGQTDSADDLIAELARLMAEDAQGAAEAPARPVRIPGGDAPAPDSFAFDIDRRPRQQAPEPAAQQQQRIEPTAFAPAFSAPKPTPRETQVVPPVAERVAPAQPAPVPTAPVSPVAIAPQEMPAPSPVFTRTEPVAPPPAEMPALDQDSLADLIAAELAVSDIAPVSEPDHPASIEELDVTEQVTGTEFPREVDSFGVPPVFGLGSGAVSKPEPMPASPAVEIPELKLSEPVLEPAPAPSPQQPAKPQPDPLEEIERLIGPAARVQQAPVAPSPALRSLATPTLPRDPEPSRVAPPSHNKTQVSSVEAATSGARVEWVEPAIEATLPPDEPERAQKAPRGRFLGMTRSLAGPVVATLLLAVAAVGLYTVLGLGTSTPDGPAPLVAADPTPTKEVPEPVPSASSQSVVFNEISGLNTGADEQIVSRDQTDVGEVTQPPVANISEEGLVNRKVRTVTVRPDGTIVSGGDSLAGSTMLPVDRPTVPDVPGADFSTPDLIANAPSPTATPAPVEATPQVVPVQPGTFVPAVDLAGNPIGGKTAPVPRLRPTSFAPQAAVTAPVASPAPVAAVATNTPAPAAAQPAATQPAATQPVAAPANGSTAPAYVQLSSQRTEEAARQTAQQIASRYGSLFGGASLEVQRVDLGERGVFYRVRVPASSLQNANTICSNVKAAGGDCFTL
jgi:hypothetical protein